MNKHVIYIDNMEALSQPAKEFIARPKQLFIDGAFVDAKSKAVIISEDPSTGAAICDVAAADKEDVNLAVKAARKAFEGEWGAQVPAGRAECLFKLAGLIYENLEELAEIESLDTGKPAHIAKALDIPFAAEVYKYYAGWATKFSGRTFNLSLNPEAFHTFTTSQPLGVVAGIIPWNYPFAQASFKLAPALAAGCTVILKPAEQTPLSALRLAELVKEAGFPDGTVNVLNGLGHTAGAALAEHNDVNKISFTGSTEIGRRIATAAANSNMKRVTLELGGKSPNIIFADANLDRAIPTAANAIFGNSGQVCNACSRLFVEAPIYDQVMAGLTELAQDMQLGAGMSGDTQLGPLMSKTQLERVSSHVERAVSGGAKVATGGTQVGDKGYFFAPTVLTNTTPDMAVTQDEIFGPVLCATTFSSDDDIIKEANNTNFGLAASIWTENLGRAHRVAGAINAGAVWVNSFGVFDPNLPFGGFKESGWGREFGPEGIDAFLESKATSIYIGE